MFFELNIVCEEGYFGSPFYLSWGYHQIKNTELEWIELLIKQKQIKDEFKKKYSEVDYFAKSRCEKATLALPRLLKENYAIMNAYYINEIIKLIRTLKELNIEYSMRVVENQNIHDGYFYEFTTPYFLDDRK